MSFPTKLQNKHVEDFVTWLEETLSLIEHMCAQDVINLSSIVS